MKVLTIRLKPKKILFRDYKHFDETLQSAELSGNSACTNENYNHLTCRFLYISKDIYLGVETNRIPFIDDNNSATSRDNINRHVEYDLLVLNSHQL